MSLDQANITTQMNDVDIESILQQYDSYIYVMARKLVPHNGPLSQETLDLEIDDIAQRARIKIWRALQKRPIQNLKGYTSSVIRTEIIDLIRRQRRFHFQTTDDDGEILQGKILISETEEQENPETTLEHQEQEEELIKMTSNAIASLPTRQKWAIICSLKDKLDDLALLVDLSENHQMDIDEITWPEEKKDLQSLKSSLSVSRKKLQNLLGSAS